MHVIGHIRRRELAKVGFDVVPARADERCHGASDEELLAIATSDQRAVVTENVADFMARRANKQL